MIFRGIFRKFPENINKTLIAARPLSARDSCNVLCLFGFGVVDKKMFYTICKYTKKVIFVRIIMNQYFGKIYRTKKLNNGSRVTGSAI